MLKGFGENLRWRFFKQVAGNKYSVKRKQILGALAKIDKSGRPLFTAIAADALKNGKRIWRFNKSALLDDLVERELRRARMAARSEEEFTLHCNAVALATMVGGLHLPADVGGLSSRHFPFDHERYNGRLIAEICDVNDPVNVISPITPDIVGEWFALRLLKPAHPFDERPAHLLTAVNVVTGASPRAAALFSAFRSRAAEDFPKTVLRTDLFDIPEASSPTHVITEWAASLVAGLKYSCINPNIADSLLPALTKFRLSRPNEIGIYRASANVYSNYAKILQERGDTEGAHSLFLELVMLAQLRTDFHELGWAASDLGCELGSEVLSIGNLSLATEIFEILLDHADKFMGVEGAEREEIAEDCASLGLSLRQHHITHGNSKEVDTLNKNLWDAPPDDRLIDLGGRTGQVLMERDDDGDVGSPLEIWAELKLRSRVRADVPEIAFWAANVGYGIAMNAKNPLAFLAIVCELRDWLRDHADWPDMADVTFDAVDNGWITPEFELGREAVEAQFKLWSEALAAVVERGGNLTTDNQVRSIREDLERSLLIHQGEEWATKLRVQLGERKMNLRVERP